MAVSEPILTVVVFDDDLISVEHSMEKSFDDVYHAHVHMRDLIQKRIDHMTDCPHHPENVNASRH